MEYLKNQFISDTVDTSVFQIEDIIGNNACLYKSVANCLHYRSKDLMLYNYR